MIDTRRVHRLRLHCGDAAQAAQAARVAQHIGDALRCATLPTAPGRVLLVRRLALGRLPPAGNAVTLSLHLQAAVQRAGWTWVRGDTPAAASASAVWFAHAAHAAAAAWAWRAAGRALDAWYWPLALPGLPLAAPLPALRPALRAWLDAQVGEGASAAWWPAADDSPTSRGARVPGRVAAPDVDAARALQSARAPLSGPLEPPSPALPTAFIGPVTVPAPTRTAPEAGGSHTPAPGSAPALDTAAEAQGHGVPGERDDGTSSTSANEHALPERRGDVANQRPRAVAAQAASPHAPRQAPAANAKPVPASASAPTAALRFTRDRPAPPTVFAGLDGLAAFATRPQPTALGGVLLLLPALRHVDWFAQPRSAPDFAALAHEAIARLRMPVDDPLHALIADLAEGQAMAARQAPARAQWRVLRQWLRHDVRIGPARLLVRRARLRWDATHIDLHFALNHADLRLRRAGLDQSPGWLPWLGRVVTVHFEDHEASSP